jgi:hypothetical protein
VGAADDAAVCVEEFTGASGDVDGSAPDNQVLQNYLSLLNAVIFVVPSIWTRLDLNDKPLPTTYEHHQPPTKLDGTTWRSTQGHSSRGGTCLAAARNFLVGLAVKLLKISLRRRRQSVLSWLGS